MVSDSSMATTQSTRLDIHEKVNPRTSGFFTVLDTKCFKISLRKIEWHDQFHSGRAWTINHAVCWRPESRWFKEKTSAALLAKKSNSIVNGENHSRFLGNESINGDMERFFREELRLESFDASHEIFF